MIGSVFLDKVFEQARKALFEGEIPVGAVIVKDGQIIAEAHNTCESDKNPVNHAEILAIQIASKKLNSWRLNGCTMYVNLEPCLMCMGAIIRSRISKLVYCAYDYHEGAFNGRHKIEKESISDIKMEIESGERAEESAKLLKEFFVELRK